MLSGISGRLDEHRKRHVASEIVFDLAALASVEFGLNRLAPLDDRHRIGGVVRGQQSETGTVVESAIQGDDLDAEVKAVKEHLAGEVCPQPPQPSQARTAR